MATKKSTNQSAKQPLLKRIAITTTKVILWFILISIIWVLFYRFVNPPITPLMIQRNWERKADDKPSKMEQTWVDFDEMSDNMKRAAVSAEDSQFLQHMGFDIKAIEKAYAANAKKKKQNLTFKEKDGKK